MVHLSEMQVLHTHTAIYGTELVEITAEVSMYQSKGFHTDILDNLLHVLFHLVNYFKDFFIVIDSQYNPIINKWYNGLIAIILCSVIHVTVTSFSDFFFF